MNKKPAFPAFLGGENRGMTLRDYFAAAALQGLCAHPELGDERYDTLAQYAYSQADAMLKARGE